MIWGDNLSGAVHNSHPRTIIILNIMNTPSNETVLNSGLFGFSWMAFQFFGSELGTQQWYCCSVECERWLSRTTVQWFGFVIWPIYCMMTVSKSPSRCFKEDVTECSVFFCVLRVLQVQQLRSQLSGMAQCQSETQRTNQDSQDKSQIIVQIQIQILQIINKIHGF